jgi:signal peptidase
MVEESPVSVSPDSAPAPAPASGPTPERHGWLRRVGAIVAWTVAVLMGALIVGLVVVPRLVGAEPFTVLTGSMRPTMPPGTMIIVRPVEFTDLRVGDVITYQLESGQTAVVTHRIISIDIGDEGTRLRTQGDANPSADIEPVRAEQVRGEVWYWVPYIGYVTSVGSGDGRANIVRVLGGALIVYAAYAVVMGIVRSRRAKAKASTAPIDTAGQHNAARGAALGSAVGTAPRADGADTEGVESAPAPPVESETTEVEAGSSTGKNPSS